MVIVLKKTDTPNIEKEERKSDFSYILSSDPKMMIRFTDRFGVLQQMQLENLYVDRNMR